VDSRTVDTYREVNQKTVDVQQTQNKDKSSKTEIKTVVKDSTDNSSAEKREVKKASADSSEDKREIKKDSVENSSEQKREAKNDSGNVSITPNALAATTRKTYVERSQKDGGDDDDDEVDIDVDEWSDDEDFYEEVDADGKVVKTDLEVESAIPEEKRNRIPSNFRTRLKLSSDKNKSYYTVIKNKLNSYRGVTFRMYGRVEKVSYLGNPIVYIGVVRRALKLWLALNPYDFDVDRYFQKDVSDKPQYEKVPMLVRIGSDRSATRVLELIEALMANQQIVPKQRYNERNLQELAYTLKGNMLVKDKKPELLCEAIHVHDVSVISDDDARRYLESRTVVKEGEQTYARVSTDTLESNFLDGQKVTLERLKKKGLLAENYTGYRVVAGTRLTKPLYVVADDISLDATRMIVLTGGRAIKLVAPEQK
jgi:hypothetical protein